MNSVINVLIPDGESTWALSVLHCLSQVEGYRLFVLSNKKRTATKFSKFTSYYKFYERKDDEHWLEVLNTEIKAKQISVVVPVAEREVSFFIKFKDRIVESTEIIPLPNLSDFEIAINKKKLSEFAVINDISHPKSIYLTSKDDIEPIGASLKFPILIKPEHQKGGDGIVRIDNLNQLKTITKRPLFIQEYIEGYDIDCSVLCLNGKVLTHTIQKGNLKGDTIYAPQLAFDFVNNDQVLKLVSSLMSKLNWSGVAHLDMRFDSQTNDYKVIEINSRFWGSVDASRVAGVNFPDLTIKLAIGDIIQSESFKLINYMRLKGVLKSIKHNPSFIFKRTYLLNNTEVKLFLIDPIPTLYKFWEWLGRKF